MTSRFSTSQQVQAPVDRVWELVVDPQIQEELTRRTGAVEARCRMGEAVGGRLRLEIDVVDGRVAGVPHRSTLEMDWDVEQRLCRWSRRDHNFGERVRASGTTRLVAEEGGCRVDEQGEVEVSIPVLGRKIERKVVQKMEAAAPIRARFWEEEATR